VVADGESFTIPATIEDAAAMDEIAHALDHHGYRAAIETIARPSV
jgi:hypothetical protein